MQKKKKKIPNNYGECEKIMKKKKDEINTIDLYLLIFVVGLNFTRKRQREKEKKEKIKVNKLGIRGK